MYPTHYNNKGKKIKKKQEERQEKCIIYEGSLQQYNEVRDFHVPSTYKYHCILCQFRHLFKN
jgi:hypothetical protein